MHINDSCICPRKECPRHGKCDECRAFHEAKRRNRIPYCENKKHKDEKREPRK